MRFNQEIDLTSLPMQLQDVMPSGIGIINVQSVDEHEPPLQTQIVSAEYEVALTEAVNEAELKRKMDEVMASPSLPRERRGKSYDLRPLIEKLELTSENKILMQLAAREGATGRPEEVLDVLGIMIEHAQVERTNLIFRN
jgi:radical SAM-linked protein